MNANTRGAVNDHHHMDANQNVMFSMIAIAHLGVRNIN